MLEQQRQLALDAARMGWWHYDLVTGRSRYDARYREIFGVTGEERPNEELVSLIHPEDRPGVLSAVAAAINPSDPQRFSIEYRITRPDGSTCWVEAHGRAQFEGEGPTRRAVSFSGTVADISARKRLENERELMVRLLGVMNAEDNTHDLMRKVTRLLHDWFDCEAVGIRLRDGPDYPYYETHGFPAEFIEKENSLCRHDAMGNPVLDGDGNPALECMCGNVLCGRFNPEKPFFTQRGSFWANNTTRLLATTTPADRQANTRNRCNAEGYESVALIALRTGTTTHGLIQLNDKRPNRFTRESLVLLERVADNLAIGIAQRQDQFRLKTSEERYRLLFDNTNDALFVNLFRGADSAPGKFIEVNAVACRRLGYTREELFQRSPRDIDSEASPDNYTRVMARLEREGEAIFEVSHTTKDGRRIPTEVSTHLFNLHGQKLLLSVARDLTERKRTEEALSLQSAALKAAANAIVITDQSGTIEWANPAFTTFTGYTVAEALGKNPRELLKSGQHDPAFYKAMWNIILAGSVWHGEIINRRKNGTLYTEDMTITPLRGPTGAITRFIAIKQDVTERKNLEAHLLRTQRLESVGRLASGIAHDLNNILSPILMAAPMLRAELHDQDAVSLVETIESSARRGADIIRQLLTFGRGLKGERISLQLATLLREMLKMIGETFPKNITIRADIPTDLPLITGDATQLHQVLMNLSVNARDAMPEGGTLSYALAPVTVTSAMASANPDARPGRYLRLDVSDTGIGIPPENMEKIFDPFFTTKAPGEGTGLGLSTVLGIARTHGGYIEISSPPGQGTRFTLYFPVTETPEPLPPTPAGEPMPRGMGEWILLVDDEDSIRRMTRRMLESKGYRIIEAQDGAEALAILEAMSQPVQAVVTDMIMPRMDGLTLVRNVRRKNPRLPFILQGGMPPSPESLSELGLSIKAFLTKPYGSTRLLTALRQALDG